MSDRSSGLYRKFNVTRTDGSSEPGGKHEHCSYFVLDLEHDPHAIPALEAYGKACYIDRPALANYIRHIVATAKAFHVTANPFGSAGPPP